MENMESISEMDKDELIENLLTRDYEEHNKIMVAIDQLSSGLGPYKTLLHNYQSLRSSRDMWKRRAAEYEKLAEMNSEWCDELVDQIRDSFEEYKAVFEACKYIMKYTDKMCVPLPRDADGVIWKGNEARYIGVNGKHFLDGFVWDGKQWRIFTVSCNGVNYSVSVDPSTVRHENKVEQPDIDKVVSDLFDMVDWSEHGGELGRRSILGALDELGIDVE